MADCYKSQYSSLYINERGHTRRDQQPTIVVVDRRPVGILARY